MTEVEKPLENQMRIDYVEQDGNIRYADDKHYATLVKTLNDECNVILEEYYDENGILEK